MDTKCYDFSYVGVKAINLYVNSLYGIVYYLNAHIYFDLLRSLLIIFLWVLFQLHYICKIYWKAYYTVYLRDTILGFIPLVKLHFNTKIVYQYRYYYAL